jgi:hypothetical protein
MVSPTRAEIRAASLPLCDQCLLAPQAAQILIVATVGLRDCLRLRGQHAGPARSRCSTATLPETIFCVVFQKQFFHFNLERKKQFSGLLFVTPEKRSNVNLRNKGNVIDRHNSPLSCCRSDILPLHIVQTSVLLRKVQSPNSGCLRTVLPQGSHFP